MLAVHNLHFLAYAYCMNGNFIEAKAIADNLVAQVQPYLKGMPMLEGFLPTQFLVLLAFERWDDLLQLPGPDASLPVTNAVWHFARAVALANLGNIDLAEKEQAAWQQAAGRVPNDTIIIELNTAGTIFKIHQHLLSAALARCRHDSKGNVDFLRQAVAAEDALNYSEPPAFYPPVGPLLGRALLETKQFAEAEKVFRADLAKNPRHRRSLSGLRDSLKAQRRDYEAAMVDQQLREPETAVLTPRSQRRK